jgi:hypothetical protein
MKRVFISSIIDGFEAYRAAARQAVVLVGFTPVMAEEFPAQPRAPRAACLDGVRSSDLYVGILGPSYGSRTESGRSATEEEFDEACALSLPTLIFKTTASMDSEQARFLERVAGRWGEGVFYGRFTSPEELKDEVIKALSAIRSEGPALSEAEASRRLEALLGSVRSEQEDVVLSLALVADTGGQPLIQLEDLERFASDLPKLVESVPPLARGGEILAKERSVELWHPPTHENPFAFFEVFEDGRFLCALGQRFDRRSDLAVSFIIDADRVERDLAQIIELFRRVLARLDPRGSAGNVYVQGSLKGVQHKVFDAIPKEPVSSMTVPWHTLPNPLPFPSRPVRVSVQSLSKPTVLAATLRATIRRIFDEALRRTC